MPTTAPRAHVHPTQACPRLAPHSTHVWRETVGKRRTLSCPGAHGRPPEGTVRLRADAFTAEALQAYGWGSPTAAARAVGVASSTLRRAIARQIAPGERLIAALMTGTGRTFESLFELVEVSHLDTPLPMYEQG